MAPTVGTNVEKRAVFVKVRVVTMDIAVGRAFMTVQEKPKKLVPVGDTNVSENKQVSIRMYQFTVSFLIVNDECFQVIMVYAILMMQLGSLQN